MHATYNRCSAAERRIGAVRESAPVVRQRRPQFEPFSSGGFGPSVFAAYREVWPLAPGAEARVPLYQVLPLLVHVCLFGGSYVGGLARAIDTARRGG